MLTALPPQVGVATPSSQGHCPVPPCTPPAPWKVDSKKSDSQAGEKRNRAGVGPGVRPCTGSDSQRPPAVSQRRELGAWGWTPEAGVGSSSSIRRETELGEQEQAGVRTTASPPTTAPVSPLPGAAAPRPWPSLHTTLPLGLRWVSEFSKPYQSGPPEQST